MPRSNRRSQDSEAAPDQGVECLTSSGHLDAVHDALARFWVLLYDPPDEHWRLLFEVAVSEIAANIVEHAKPTQVRFKLRATDDRVEAEFADTGQAYAGPVEGIHDEFELAERGRGLAL